MAMLAHLLTFVAAGIGPLVIYFVRKDQSPFVRHHAAEALNLTITAFIAPIGIFLLGGVFLALGSVIDVLFGVGFSFLFLGQLLAFVSMIGGAVLSVMGAVKANGGEVFRMPLILHLVK